MDLQLPEDFREFLKLLNSLNVEYLLVGGYAVVWHGYARSTNDMDVWVAVSPKNAKRILTAVREFGFDVPEVTPELFETPGLVIRMGEEPLRIEVLTSISGVEFDECFAAREIIDLEGLSVNVIDLKHLRINKAASGRTEDINDLKHLPQ